MVLRALNVAFSLRPFMSGAFRSPTGSNDQDDDKCRTVGAATLEITSLNDDDIVTDMGK